MHINRPWARRVPQVFVPLILAALLGACGGGSEPDCAASAESDAARLRCSAKAGDLLSVTLSEFLPTQPSLGYDEVYYKLGRYKLGKDAINKRFDDWCEANGQEAAATTPAGATIKDANTFSCKVAIGAESQSNKDVMKTAVIGPRGRAYLTDGHHTFTSFYETADGGPNVKVRVLIQANLSALSEADFWTEMQQRQWTWLRDASDSPITPGQLPTSLGLAKFANDPYRAALYFGRDIGYQQLSTSTSIFQEFYWGRWLRAHPTIKLANYDMKDLNSYLTLVKAFTQAQTAMPDAAIVSDGKTALQLGKLQSWNSGAAETAGEYAKLTKPYSDSKPGKLAYALEYKKTVAP